MRATRAISATGLALVVIAISCSSSERRADSPAPRSVRSVLEEAREVPELAPHLGAGGHLVVNAGGFACPSPPRRFGGFSEVGTGLAVELPVEARGPLRIAIEGRDDLSIALVDESARPSNGEIVEGAIVYRDAALDTDLVRVTEGSRFEELRVLRSPRAPATTVFRVELGRGLAEVRTADGRVAEAVDRQGAVVLATLPMFAVDARGVRRTPRVRSFEEKPASGRFFIETSVDTTGLAFPVIVDPVWTPVGANKRAHRNHAAIALSPTRVLVAGGFGLYAPNVEQYDTGTKSWSMIGSMKYGRELFPITLLPGGDLLVEGGYTDPHTERYNPLADKWTELSTMSVARFAHTATTLPDGTVLVVGGTPDNAEPGWSTAEKFDPATNTWSSVASMSKQRFFHVGAALPDGRVLVAGGSTRKETLSSVEIYEPSTKTWVPGPPMTTPRLHATSVVLASGAILVIGGLDASGNALSTAEIVDAKATAWTPTKPMSITRATHTATRLASGRVLVTGGQTTGGIVSSSEVYDPVSDTWKSAGPMTAPRCTHTATLLGDDSVLVTGGSGITLDLSTSEIFTLVGRGEACGGPAACTTDFCVDGVCCETACTGSCEACDLVGSAGTCVAIGSGPVHPSHTCGPYARCSGGKCATSCASSGECASGFHCKDKACVPRAANGLACSTPEECKSGFCVDSVCCDAVCGGQCEACDVSDKLGVCTFVKGAPHGARTACGDGSSCAATCLGSAKTCGLPEAGEPCSDACLDEHTSTRRQCDGLGGCLPAGDPTTCPTDTSCRDGECAPKAPVETAVARTASSFYACRVGWGRGDAALSLAAIAASMALITRRRR